VYSNFYKIPLPALRFEKVEETDTKSERHRRELRSTTSDVRNQKRHEGRHTTLIDSNESENDTQSKLTRFPNNETQTEKERQ